MTIILVVLVVLGVVIYFAARRDKSEPTDIEQSSQQTPAPSQVERAVQQTDQSVAQSSEQGLQPDAEPVPLAGITVDGKADEWAQVPAVLIIRHDKWSSKNYKCKAVKLARDAANLYILFELSLGIGERYEQQLATPPHRPTSSALGYLKLYTAGGKFTIWIPTGVSTTYDTITRKLTKQLPMASFEVGHYNAQTNKYDDVFEAESIENPEFVAFKGKFLELKIPIEKLGIQADSSIRIELNEM